MGLNLAEPWLAFKHAAVRQLAFALASPNILRHIPPELDLTHRFELHTDAFWQQHFQAYLPRLIALDQQPQPLLAFLAQLKSTRLGLRFEMLIWFWLLDDDYHPYQLLGHSIQKIEGARTLGELDFVVLNRETLEVEHWEVAVKYYLAEADFSLNHWYGLNRTDRLSRKLQHFTQKQFQFQQALDYPIQRRFCVLKGQLYLPHPHQPEHIPAWVNLTRRLGIWGRQIPSCNYYRLQRHEWLCPHLQLSSLPNPWCTDGLYKHTELQQYYMYRQSALLTYG